MYDPYNVLGVSPLASFSEIKSAYKKLCKKYHPDNQDDTGSSNAEKFVEVSKAFKAISKSHSKGEESRSIYSFKTLFNIQKIRRTI